MYTKLHIMISVCINSAWDTLARFMANGREVCVIRNFYPIMASVLACYGVCGTVDGCVTVSIDASFHHGKYIMYRVIIPSSNRGSIHRDVPFIDI